METQDEQPSKRRREKHRVRVTRACDSCKKKKLRCTGTLPCYGCNRTGKKCEYTADYNRGKVPLVRFTEQPTHENNEQHNQLKSAVEAAGLSSSPQPRLVQNSEMLESNQAGDNPPSRASLEPHQTDSEGHYVGPSSGVSFLIRAQRKLYKYLELPMNTPIFTFGDCPLPEAESMFMLLPPRDEADALVARYFDFAFPTHRFLHQQQVEGWVDEFYRAVLGSEAVVSGMQGKRAVVLMVFAQAKQSQSELYGASNEASTKSAAYFVASEKQLSAETGPVRLTSVQARLAQCFYLLSQSRINHCWSLFGTTARLAMAIGLHRNRKRELGTSVDLVEFECRKRVFWCAYSLDNYLSAALGRPRIFHDHDIDQDFPAVVDDPRILQHQILPPTSTRQSIMLAALYHAKLSVIIGHILHDMYGAQRSTSQTEASAAARHGTDLTNWRQEISSFLDSSNVDLLILIYQRQYTVLNLAFYHAQILLYRPFMIKHLGTLADPDKSQDDFQGEPISQYINMCLIAATEIAGVIRELCEKRRMYSTFWFTHYYGFSAIMILYVRVIQLAAQKDNPEEVSKYLHIGEQAQRDLTNYGSRSSSVQRYVVVLEELRQEARAAMNRSEQQPLRNNIGDDTLSYENAPPEMPGALENHQLVQPDGFGTINGHLDINKAVVDGHGDELQGANLMIHPSLHSNPPQWVDGAVDNNFALPGSEFADWGELDSLAVAGMGELDVVFSHGWELNG